MRNFCIKFAVLYLLFPLMHSTVWAADVPQENIEAGRLIVANRKLGNCYSCHQVQGVELAGNVGPPLVGMKARYPQRADLVAQIYDPRIRNPKTVMPPYGAHGILTEQELKLVVDYLLSL
jgi:sulfur-oxidizing protein SoxX